MSFKMKVIVYSISSRRIVVLMHGTRLGQEQAGESTNRSQFVSELVYLPKLLEETLISNRL